MHSNRQKLLVFADVGFTLFGQKRTKKNFSFISAQIQLFWVQCTS